MFSIAQCGLRNVVGRTPMQPGLQPGHDDLRPHGVAINASIGGGGFQAGGRSCRNTQAQGSKKDANASDLRPAMSELEADLMEAQVGPCRSAPTASNATK